MQSKSTFLDVVIDTNLVLPKKYSGRMTLVPSTMCFVSSGSRVSRSVLRVGVITCCDGILRIDKLNPKVLPRVMLYVHEHNFESPWP